MTYIKQIEPEEAEGKLGKLYTDLAGARGSVANIYKLHSLDAELLQVHRDTYYHTMFKPGGLKRIEREAIAVAVSVSNECHY